MAIVTTDDKYYKAIADAIRGCFAKDNTSGYDPTKSFTPSEMAQAAVDAYQCGYDNGHYEGFPEGYGTGYDEGHAAGVMDGYEQGVEEGKEQGKIELLQASKYMNATSSGAVVAVNDLSPIEHDVAVQLSSDTVADFSGVTVKQYGRNLCPKAPKSTTHSGITYTQNEDGTVTANGTATALSYFDIATSSRTCPKVPVGTKLYISGCPDGGSSTTYYLYFPWVGWYEYGKGFVGSVTTSTLATNWRQSVRIEIKSGVTVENLVFKPQVELDSFSDYVPYIAPSNYTANANGTVGGVKSMSPNMTLVTDTDGVTINCSYLRDIDAYIDSLTMGVSMAAVDGTSGNEVM